MKVTLAKTAGFCFGVKRAVEKGKQVYTLGPIIHNEEVVSDLEKKGVKVIDEQDLEKKEEDGNELSGSTVVIRSHGVSEAVYQALEEKNVRLWTPPVLL